MLVATAYETLRSVSGSEWKELRVAADWPSFRAGMPHAADAEKMLVERLITGEASRVLDLGSGDGHMIALLRERWPDMAAIGLDLSPGLVDAARQRFGGADGIRIETHDLMQPLPSNLGKFDVVVSALAIHHLPDGRKRRLFAEVFELLLPNGVFYDLDVVTAPTAALHALSQSAFGFDSRQQDPSDQPARLEDQLRWLHEAGFGDVYCFWKWLELSLVGGRRA
jgi:tRNA (cmo5U34)-methyltransferase